MALFSKFFGSTISEAAAFALGGAMRSPLEPPLAELTNQTWERFVGAGITLPSDVGDAAAIAAEDATLVSWAHSQAAQQGIGGDQMDKLIVSERTAPGLGTLYQSLRRGDITSDEFSHGLRKAKMETRWDKALLKLKVQPLEPADLARAIHRGLIDDHGILGQAVKRGTDKVATYPQFAIDAVDEASWAGLDKPHLATLVGVQGNPMGAHEAAQALFRGIITHDDYLHAIAEGNTRNEWADAIEAQTRQIPTAHDFVENRLRGYRDQKHMYDGTARHGMSEADTDVLFQNAGRPLAIHQITTGLARGGTFNPIPGELTDPFDAASHESNLKPSYYDLNKANRYTMPSVLAIRQLGQSGVWDAATVEKRLLWSGWYPDDAKQVAQAWQPAAGGSMSAAVKSAQGRFITAIHKARVGGAITHQQMLEQLALSELSASDQAGVAAFFEKEYALNQIPPPTTP